MGRARALAEPGARGGLQPHGTQARLRPAAPRPVIGPRLARAAVVARIDGEDVPQAYLVSQPPHSTTRPHFHLTNQFQVFVGGGGRVGKLRADPLTVQYAGGHTVYGPIAAGEDGVRYFTLRQFWDPGAKYMPGARARLRKESVSAAGESSNNTSSSRNR